MWSSFSLQRPLRVSRSLISTFCASISTKVSAEVATGRRTPSGAIVSSTPAARAGRHVDRVVADAEAGDQLEPAIGAGQARRGDAGQHRADRVVARRLRRRHRRGSGSMNSQAMPAASNRPSTASPKIGVPSDFSTSAVMPTRNSLIDRSLSMRLTSRR